MKKVWMMLMFLFGSVGLAYAVDPSTAVVPATTSFMEWIVANKALFIALLIAVLSEVMALNPSWKSNGILDLIINFLKSSQNTTTTS